MTTKKITTYEAWNLGKIGGFGSFHTLLLQCYRLADNDNRRKLQKGFPDYFVKKDFITK